MVFTISDLHGDQERFHKLLEAINLSSHDTLYVIGDVIDRKEHGISLLFEIMTMPNVKVVMGNHEAMLLAFAHFGKDSRWGKLWFSNHNEYTVRDYLALSDSKKQDLVAWLDSLPLSMDIECGKQKYHLVHGFPSEDDFTKLWYRPSAHSECPFSDRIAIIGHSHTCLLTHPDLFERQRHLRQLKRRRDHMKIYHGNGFIDIDCGCGYSPGVPSALACFVLDTKDEIYIR